jgi:DNA-binding transcriptional LysR family regulator
MSRGVAPTNAAQVQEQRAEWDARRAAGSMERVEMTLEGEGVSVLPLWVAVHQEAEGGLARHVTLLCVPELAPLWVVVHQEAEGGLARQGAPSVRA